MLQKIKRLRVVLILFMLCVFVIYFKKINSLKKEECKKFLAVAKARLFIKYIILATVLYVLEIYKREVFLKVALCWINCTYFSQLTAFLTKETNPYPLDFSVCGSLTTLQSLQQK